MKKIAIIALLALAATGTQAQTTAPVMKNNATCKKAPNMPANAKMVWPKFDYIPTGDPSCPPCYEYTTRRGLEVMECPFLRLPPEHNNTASTMNTTSDVVVNPYPISKPMVSTTRTDDQGNFEVQARNTYTGNFAGCRRDPGMPKNAKPAWPSFSYTPTGDPSCPPCYEYKTKRGLEVMECPFLRLPPER